VRRHARRGARRDAPDGLAAARRRHDVTRCGAHDVCYGCGRATRHTARRQVQFQHWRRDCQPGVRFGAYLAGGHAPRWDQGVWGCDNCGRDELSMTRHECPGENLCRSGRRRDAAAGGHPEAPPGRRRRRAAPGDPGGERDPEQRQRTPTGRERQEGVRGADRGDAPEGPLQRWLRGQPLRQNGPRARAGDAGAGGPGRDAPEGPLARWLRGAPLRNNPESSAGGDGREEEARRAADGQEQNSGPGGPAEPRGECRRRRSGEKCATRGRRPGTEQYSRGAGWTQGPRLPAKRARP
jgi:hypothetical protein